MKIDENFEKYKDVVLKFSSYYKYSFTFSGVAEDGAVVVARTGGDSSDIYRYEVSNDMSLTLKDASDYNSAYITKDGVTLWEYDSY